MNYIKLYNTYNDYDANPNKGQQIPIVSMVKGQKQLYYPTFPKYNLLDILYSDSSGNLSVTPEVLPISDNLTPIGLCIIPTSFIGPFYKARFIALKWMNNVNGSTGKYSFVWGNTETSTLTPLSNIFKNSSIGNGFLQDYNPGNKVQNIIAFVKVKEYENQTQLQIKTDILNKLPSYMCPKIKIVKEFPINKNGKCDERRLLEEF